ncbi:MAG TPA: thioredoxin domain-containing protein [Candidatus Binataceae bacterium]|nr:thioredoxin domain-containing protein [Candidatus Binataceae bacterium]
MVQRNTSALLAVSLLGLGSVIVAAAGWAASGDSSTVLATVGQTKITQAQVDAKAKPQLAAIQTQIYQIRKQTLDQMINDYLIQQAAKAAGLSEQAYLKKEVNDKVKPPSEAEIQAFYKQNQSRIHQPLEKIRAPLVSFMERQQLQAAQNQLLSDLRAKAKIDVLMQVPRVQVATTNSAGVLGPAQAPVTVVEFSDFQCPFCRRAEDSIKEVLQKYPSQIHFVYMDFPLSIHAHAMQAAVAGRCAADQGKFWPMHDAMFADQNKLDPAGLKATAAHLKLDTKSFDECLDKGEHTAEIHQSEAEGNSLGVDGTPTFFINGIVMSGAQPASAIEETINSELARAKNGNPSRTASD